ncbi:E3 ubiquitin-protein ligase trim9 [Chamberlinius hualienensis]
MEEEIKCGVCKQLFTNPVLLPCYHSLCLNCAVHIQQPATSGSSPAMMGSSSTASSVVPSTTANSNATSATSSTSEEDNLSDQCPLEVSSNVVIGVIDCESDKLSILSETDSGVVCSSSRPNSYVGTPNIQGVVFQPFLFPNQTTVLSLTCPLCHKVVYFDENGAHNLLKNRAMQNIADKYYESKNLAVKCQMCADGVESEAEIMCEQCEILYCSACKESCHPSRGPLAKHTLINPQQGRANLRLKNKGRQALCGEHIEETLGMYCMQCSLAACAMCLQEGRHHNHDVQALSLISKAQKTELSQNLQQLSEKAKVTTELIQRLKLMSERLNDSCSDVEELIRADCDRLREALSARAAQLINYVRLEKDFRSKALREQVSSCTSKLQQTTGLLQFCIEALKETDPTAFLQIGASLIHRVCVVDVNWPREMPTAPQVSTELQFNLDDKPLLNAIQLLNFAQLKRKCSK